MGVVRALDAGVLEFKTFGEMLTGVDLSQLEQVWNIAKSRHERRTNRDGR